MSKVYLWYISQTSQLYFMDILSKSKIYLRYISCLSHEHLWYTSGISQAYRMYISGKNQLYPRQLSDIAPPAPSIMLSQPKKTGGSTMVQVILWPKQGSKMKMIIFQHLLIR